MNTLIKATSLIIALFGLIATGEADGCTHARIHGAAYGLKDITSTLSHQYIDLFDDVRAMRQPVAGSVPYGQLQIDSEMFAGVREDWSPAEGADAEAVAADLTKYVTEFPEEITVDDALLARGKQRISQQLGVKSLPFGAPPPSISRVPLANLGGIGMQ